MYHPLDQAGTRITVGQAGAAYTRGVPCPPSQAVGSPRFSLQFGSELQRRADEGNSQPVTPPLCRLALPPTSLRRHCCIFDCVRGERSRRAISPRRPPR